MRSAIVLGIIAGCIVGVFAGKAVASIHHQLHCYSVAEFARETPRFFVYQSEEDACAKYHINIPANVSVDYHGV